MTCPDCKSEVTESDSACPVCGCPSSYFENNNDATTNKRECYEYRVLRSREYGDEFVEYIDRYAKDGWRVKLIDCFRIPPAMIVFERKIH